MSLLFFTGPNCSLCDDAEELLNSLDFSVNYRKVNIREHNDYYHLYALKIPVLKREDNQQELCWPFNLNELKQFLQ